MDYALLAISFCIFLIFLFNNIRINISLKYKKIIISIFSSIFLLYSIFFLISDYFTGKGVDDAVIYHLRYGVGGAGFKDYTTVIIAAGLGILTSLTLPYIILNKFADNRKTGKKTGRYVLMSILFAVLSFAVHPATYGFYKELPIRLMTWNIKPEDFGRYFRKPVVQQASRKRNLVYIYLESVERTYFDQSIFPGLIEELRDLDAISITFTDIRQVSGTGWTMGGMVASQCGIPLITPSHKNSMSGMDLFLPNAVCIGDILSKEGYQLSFLRGASNEFAGTGKFYRTHGFDDVLGKENLVKTLSDQTYLNAWGLYDDSLLENAYKNFLYLSGQEKNFGLFLLTVDTHNPIGHPSKSCQSREYDDGYNSMLNAVKCTDFLVGKFVRKIMQSEYADNTVIVIASDHLAMRNTVTRLLDMTERRNLFMVIVPGGKGKVVEKPGSMLDVAPTAYSGAKRPPIPEQSGHRFRSKAATDSDSFRPLIPEQSGHIEPL